MNKLNSTEFLTQLFNVYQCHQFETPLQFKKKPTISSIKCGPFIKKPLNTPKGGKNTYWPKALANTIIVVKIYPYMQT